MAARKKTAVKRVRSVVDGAETEAQMRARLRQEIAAKKEAAKKEAEEASAPAETAEEMEARIRGELALEQGPADIEPVPDPVMEPVPQVDTGSLHEELAELKAKMEAATGMSYEAMDKAAPGDEARLKALMDGTGEYEGTGAIPEPPAEVDPFKGKTEVSAWLRDRDFEWLAWRARAESNMRKKLFTTGMMLEKLVREAKAQDQSKGGSVTGGKTMLASEFKDPSK